MKAYLMTTAVVFGLLTLAHLLRIVLEGRQLATNPIYVLITLVAAGLCLWACSLLRSVSRRDTN